jgi:hypothetical protein
MDHEQAMLLAPRDAGRLLGITSAGVIRLCERGQLPAIRDSANRRLFRRADVVRLVGVRDAKRRSREQQGVTRDRRA